MFIYRIIIIFLLPILSFAQVGINDDIPSDASALDINSQMTINFGGLKLPIVTIAQRAQIPVSLTSDGVMVYVDYGTSRCLEIYDSVSSQWQQINCSFLGPTTIYSEDFDSYTTGTGINGSGNSGDYPGAVSKWTLTDLNNTLLSGDYVETQSGALEVNDTNGPIQFETQSININGYSSVSFSLDLSGVGPLEYDGSLHSTDDTNTVNDYVNVSYSIDGGSFITITDFNSNGTLDHTLVPIYTSGTGNSAPFFPNETVTRTGINGSTLMIRVLFQNWSGDEYLLLDNIAVTGM